jgi:phosphatidylserine synthase 2
MGRIALQFTPYNWVPFEWKPTQSLGRWFAVLGVIVLYQLCELCTFYLKFILWVPPEHWLNPTRLVLYLLTGSVAMREFFQFFDDPNCNKFGYQSWIVCSSIIVEVLIAIKVKSMIRWPMLKDYIIITKSN